jgi:NMD protein affecting ribosome stability and mRNA decay
MTAKATRARVSGGCHRCGAEYDAWSLLELVELVNAERVRSLTKSWDSKQRVEVRRCPRCGAALARLANGAETRPT